MSKTKDEGKSFWICSRGWEIGIIRGLCQSEKKKPGLESEKNWKPQPWFPRKIVTVYLYDLKRVEEGIPLDYILNYQIPLVVHRGEEREEGSLKNLQEGDIVFLTFRVRDRRFNFEKTSPFRLVTMVDQSVELPEFYSSTDPARFIPAFMEIPSEEIVEERVRGKLFSDL